MYSLCTSVSAPLQIKLNFKKLFTSVREVTFIGMLTMFPKSYVAAGCWTIKISAEMNDVRNNANININAALFIFLLVK